MRAKLSTSRSGSRSLRRGDPLSPFHQADAGGAADAHHQRVLAQQEKEKQRKQHERTIRKQKEANKRLRAHYVEACNTRAGDERIRKRRAVFARPTKEPRVPEYLVGRRVARYDAEQSAQDEAVSEA